MMRNNPFKRLVVAFFVNQLGTAISTALVVFYIRNVLAEEQSSILMLLVYYGFALIGIPFWISFSVKVSKHRTWCLALDLFGFFQMGYFFRPWRLLLHAANNGLQRLPGGNFLGYPELNES